MGRKYPNIVEGENGWSEWLHPLKGYRMMCCDCGLIHEMQFRVIGKKRIIFRANRDVRATAATRRRKRDFVEIKQTEAKIAAHITSRMKTVSPSLSAAQALDDLRMAVESGDYEATP